jgi:hypothetical protein
VARARVAADVGEETAVWWWRFVICADLTNRESSAVVIGHCDGLRRALAGPPAGLADEIARRSPTADPAAVVEQWIDALDTIRREAVGTAVCEWTGTM